MPLAYTASMEEHPVKKDPAKDPYKFATPQPVTAGPMPHPGPWVASLLKDFRCPVSRAAELMEVNRPSFIKTLNGGQALTTDLAYRLEALTGVDADILIAMQAQYERDRDAEKRASYKAAIARLEPPAEAAE